MCSVLPWDKRWDQLQYTQKYKRTHTHQKGYHSKVIHFNSAAFLRRPQSCQCSRPFYLHPLVDLSGTLMRLCCLQWGRGPGNETKSITFCSWLWKDKTNIAGQTWCWSQLLARPLMCEFAVQSENNRSHQWGFFASQRFYLQIVRNSFKAWLPTLLIKIKLQSLTHTGNVRSWWSDWSIVQFALSPKLIYKRR